MKRLLITEEQFNILKDINILNESMGQLNESINLKYLVEKYKAAIAAGVAATAILLSINQLKLPCAEKDWLKKDLGIEQMENSPIRQKKIDAVTKYMQTALKNQGFPLENLKLSPEKIVDICEETGFDLPLLLAQAHQESCFGMTNRARNTNSVWSVGSWDNGKNLCTYSDQNNSILPYINLMKRDYLNNKTIDELLKPGNFVNMNGHRYASDSKYENKIKFLRNRIISQYPELLS